MNDDNPHNVFHYHGVMLGNGFVTYPNFCCPDRVKDVIENMYDLIDEEFYRVLHRKWLEEWGLIQ